MMLVEILRLFGTWSGTNSAKCLQFQLCVDPSFSNHSFPCYTMLTTIMVWWVTYSQQYLTDASVCASTIFIWLYISNKEKWRNIILVTRQAKVFDRLLCGLLLGWNRERKRARSLQCKLGWPTRRPSQIVQVSKKKWIILINGRQTELIVSF